MKLKFQKGEMKNWENVLPTKRKVGQMIHFPFYQMLPDPFLVFSCEKIIYIYIYIYEISTNFTNFFIKTMPRKKDDYIY
jgi:hypothetical protein